MSRIVTPDGRLVRTMNADPALVRRLNQLFDPGSVAASSGVGGLGLSLNPLDWAGAVGEVLTSRAALGVLTLGLSELDRATGGHVAGAVEAVVDWVGDLFGGAVTFLDAVIDQTVLNGDWWAGLAEMVGVCAADIFSKGAVSGQIETGCYGQGCEVAGYQILSCRQAATQFQKQTVQAGLVAAADATGIGALRTASLTDYRRLFEAGAGVSSAVYDRLAQSAGFEQRATAHSAQSALQVPRLLATGPLDGTSRSGRAAISAAKTQMVAAAAAMRATALLEPVTAPEILRVAPDWRSTGAEAFVRNGRPTGSFESDGIRVNFGNKAGGRAAAARVLSTALYPRLRISIENEVRKAAASGEWLGPQAESRRAVARSLLRFSPSVGPTLMSFVGEDLADRARPFAVEQSPDGASVAGPALLLGSAAAVVLMMAHRSKRSR